MRTHLDLFSGIGGFALAAQWAGFQTGGFCEIEPYCQKLLKQNFPNTPIHTDVRNTADFTQYRDRIDLLTGGFPCQPFSVAGKQLAEDDPRSLFPAMLDIIKVVRPAWVIGENVTGIINLALDEVLTALEGEGYTTGTVIIPACAVNASHRRDRVWIIAHSEGERHGRGSGERREARERELFSREQEGGAVGREVQGCDSERISTNSLSNRQQGELRENSFNSPRSHEALHTTPFRGFDTEQLSPPYITRTSDGLPNRSYRIKGLGNAIVPQVAYEIIKLIP